MRNNSLGDIQEGYVVRNSESFLMNDFKLNVAKYVEKSNLNFKDGHWMFNKNKDVNKLLWMDKK